MISKTYPLGSFERYKYVVIMSRMDGGFLLSRHKQRTTWEFQGGHIEPGETPMQAARRELFEESGAAAFDIAPLRLLGGQRGRAERRVRRRLYRGHPQARRSAGERNGRNQTL